MSDLDPGRHGFAVLKLGNRYVVTNTADGWKSNVGSNLKGATAYLTFINLAFDRAKEKV